MPYETNPAPLRCRWVALGAAVAVASLVVATGHGGTTDGPQGAPASCCQVGENTEAGAPHLADDAFVATMTCRFECLGGETGTARDTRTFRPRERGLRPGDGSDGTSAPWGSFTATLEAWSRFVCLEVASERCGGLGEVGASDLVEVASGSWTLARRVLCPTFKEARRIERHGRDPGTVFPGYSPILSPFEPGSGAVTEVAAEPAPPDALPVPPPGAVLTGPRSDPTRRSVDTYEYWMRRAVADGKVPEDLVSERQIRRYLLHAAGVGSRRELVEKMKRDNGIAPPEPCSRVLRGRACFGDCLTFPAGVPMMQFMATNEVGAENTGRLAVCGDRLAEFYATHRMTDRVKEIYCERFIADSVVAGRATASSCSSFRFRVDCSDLF